jgi:hypothetical protein
MQTMKCDELIARRFKNYVGDSLPAATFVGE